MKVAIIHDWLVTNAGAEKVLKAILDIFPQADIFAIVDFLDDKDRLEILNGKEVKTSFIQKLPFAKKYFRHYLPLFPKAVESFDFCGYDMIISSSWAFAKGITKSQNQIHICYCHTPIRYAWDLYDEYTSNLKFPKKMIVQLTLKYIRKWDISRLDMVDYFIANSNFVANRIKKTYNKDAIVIYPPVNTDKFTIQNNKEEYYITVSRLVPYKKTRLIVEAFNELQDKKLIVIGDGEEMEYIKSVAKSNITILGYQSQADIIKYLQNAKAFVYCAIEDFGIAPIEANSCGTPVIALNKGGTKETIQDGINGTHFEEQTKEDIIDAIYKFEGMKFDFDTISNNTKVYSEERFIAQFLEYINSI